MSKRKTAAISGVLGTLVLAAVAWFVAVSSASPDPVPNSVVLQPHGGAPTIYAGPGNREQLSGLWRFKKDPEDRGFDKGYQAGKFGGGELVKVPFVPDATKISGDKGMKAFRGTIGWYRTKIDVPVDGMYAIRFESVNHRVRVYVDGKLEGEHKGEYLPFDVRVPLTAGTRHALVVRADWRGPAAMKADGWHRLWFNFGGINRGVSIRRIGNSEISHPEMNTTLAGSTATVDMKIHLRNNLEPRMLGAKGALIRGERRVPVEFPAEPIAKGGTEVLQTQVKVDSPDLWSPAAPNLWELELEVPGESTYRARVGIREVRAQGSSLLLNGKPIKLRGASIHEDVFGRGDALRPIDQDRIVDHLKDIDANATRSQHPIDPGLLERFDAAGIMVWQGVGSPPANGCVPVLRPLRIAEDTVSPEFAALRARLLGSLQPRRGRCCEHARAARHRRRRAGGRSAAPLLLVGAAAAAPAAPPPRAACGLAGDDLGRFPARLAAAVARRRRHRAVGGPRPAVVPHAQATIAEAAVGFALAAVLGLALAILITRSRVAEHAVYPWLVASQAIPILAVAPLVAIWLDYGTAQVMVAFVIAFFPVVVTGVDGLRAVDPALAQSVRTLGASRPWTFRRVTLPAALPALFSGLRMAAVFAVTGAVVAEYVGADRGLGYFSEFSTAQFATARSFAAILLLAVIGMAFFGLVGLAERLLLPHRRHPSRPAWRRR